MTPMNVATRARDQVQPCGCGCSDCQGGCCDLDCLSRPNFFCGQVLTDDDLKALVDWTNAKAALQRYTTGWGVAHGLEVSCWHTAKASGVKVSAGYAIDCCGRDIVVCEPLTYQFKCDKPFDPCCKKKDEAPNNDNTEGDDTKLACIPASELRAFELCIAFDEKHTAGQRPLARGGCGPLADCQATRIIETGRLYAKEITDPCVVHPADRTDEYRRKLKSFIDELTEYKTPKALRDWVYGKLHSFCFVEECLCELSPNEQVPMAQWYGYVIQDWRNDYFQTACDPCAGNICEGDGVPLARVWVWDRSKDNCRSCSVVYIDAYPPYRRFLSNDCSSQSDCLDLTKYIWRDVEEVRLELHKLGYGVVDVTEVNNLEGLIHLAELPPHLDLTCAQRNDPLRIHSYADYCNRQRVVLFERPIPQ
jgi:hypothetical protein